MSNSLADLCKWHKPTEEVFFYILNDDIENWIKEEGIKLTDDERSLLEHRIEKICDNYDYRTDIFQVALDEIKEDEE